MKKIGILILVLLAAAGGYLVREKVIKNETPQITNVIVDDKKSENSDNTGDVKFDNPKKGAHFETSTPAHGSTVAAVPAGVVIDFNFDLATNSTIQITKDGKDYGIGQATVDANKLALRRQMDLSAPDGVYTVNYSGCWPDKTCHDGHFQFAINRNLAGSYEDRRGQKELTIKMSQIKFQPMNIQLSSGTKVTWVNDDSAEHYINTDSHPAHSHIPSLNSKALAKGASYSYTFNDQGAYPYHCSAHAANMTGNILVD